QAGRVEQADQRADLAEVEMKLAHQRIGDRAYRLEVKAQPHASDEQQRKDCPARTGIGSLHSAILGQKARMFIQLGVYGRPGTWGPMTRAGPSRPIVLVALRLAGCARPPLPVPPPATPAAEDLRVREIDERKDELLRQLAVCESGAHGDSPVPVI